MTKHEKTPMNAETQDVTAVVAPETMMPVDPMVGMIERMVMDQSVDLDRLDRMFAMKDRLDADTAKKAYASAFSKMQSALPVIAERGEIKNRDKVVQSTYPLWEDVIDALRGPLASNGLSMSFDRRKEGQVTVIGCIVTHDQGHSMRAEIDLPRDDSGSKNAVQGEGSTVSYGQRYSSKMLINWISEGTEDNDGATAGKATIGPEQIDEIEATVEKIGIKISVILNAERIEAIHYLPESRFQFVMGQLRDTANTRGVQL
jgi:hypothetical protein